MATAFKSLDTHIPFTSAPRPNIRVVWSQGAAAQAVGAALAHQPIAEATLEELAIADLTRGVVATARELLSPRMYAAFLSWGEAASRFETFFLTDEEGDVRSGVHLAALADLAGAAAVNEHDLALKRYLLAIEITDSTSFGPVLIDQDACVTRSGDTLVRGLGPDMVPQSPLTEAINALAVRAWDWSNSSSAWTNGIGGAITAVFAEARRLLEEEGEPTAKPLDLSAYDMWMRGPLIAWNRQYDRVLSAENELRTYDRDTHSPTFAKNADADEATCDAVQARYDELVTVMYDELHRLWLLPAPGAGELATKLKLIREHGGMGQGDADAYVEALTIDARRFGRHGAHLETDRRLLSAFSARRQEHEADDTRRMSEEAETAYFARIDAAEEVILKTKATTIEGVLAKLRVAFASKTLEGWSEDANGDVSTPKFIEGLRMADLYDWMIWSAVVDLARIGGVNLSEQGR